MGYQKVSTPRRHRLMLRIFSLEFYRVMHGKGISGGAYFILSVWLIKRSRWGTTSQRMHFREEVNRESNIWHGLPLQQSNRDHISQIQVYSHPSLLTSKSTHIQVYSHPSLLTITTTVNNTDDRIDLISLSQGWISGLHTYQLQDAREPKVHSGAQETSCKSCARRYHWRLQTRKLRIPLRVSHLFYSYSYHFIEADEFWKWW